MKFLALQPQLDKWIENEKKRLAASGEGTPQVESSNQEQNRRTIRPFRDNKVAGGDIIWKPIDRTAAMMLSKAPWWAQPPAAKPETKPVEVETPKAKKQKRKRTHMSNRNIVESGGVIAGSGGPNDDFISTAGLRITRINGEDFIHMDSAQQFLAAEIAKLPKETRPNVLAAQDARKIIEELLNGIGSDMERFNASTKQYLTDIRQTRFAVVTETAQMTKELKDVRQFFLGSDYKEQIERLREFVDLCERLKKLKDSGFLDSVADTMLRLDATKP